LSTSVEFSEIVRFLQDDEWKFSVDEEERITMGLTGKHASYRILIRFRPDKDIIIVRVYYPVRVPEDKRRDICETITRANYGLMLGCFEMDMSDGELLYRTAMPVDDAPLYREQLKTILYTACGTADRYYPAIMGVLYGGKEPEAAIAEVEEDQGS